MDPREHGGHHVPSVIDAHPAPPEHSTPAPAPPVEPAHPPPGSGPAEHTPPHAATHNPPGAPPSSPVGPGTEPPGEQAALDLLFSVRVDSFAANPKTLQLPGSTTVSWRITRPPGAPAQQIRFSLRDFANNVIGITDQGARVFPLKAQGALPFQLFGTLQALGKTMTAPIGGDAGTLTVQAAAPALGLLNVQLQLQSIHCYRQGDGGATAEPYLWTVFYKLDGDTVFVDVNQVDQPLNLQGTATVSPTSGNQGDLQNTNVRDGDDVPIPAALGTYTTVLKPLPVRAGANLLQTVDGAVGCVVVLLEDDGTSAAAIATGHRQLNSALQNELNALIPTLGLSKPRPTPPDIRTIMQRITRAVENAIASRVDIWDLVTSLGNNDDLIGSGVFTFQSADLAAAGSGGIRIYQRWQTDDGDWDIRGRIVAAAVGTRPPAWVDPTTT